MSITYVIAPDAIIRYVSGTALVLNGSRAKCYRSDDRLLPAVLSGFARPAAVEGVVGHFPPEQQDTARIHVDRLKAIGALLVAGKDATPEPNPPRAVQAQLALLADTIQRLAGSLAAMGSYAARRITESTGISPSTRLAALAAGLRTLEHEVNNLRTDYVAEQLQQIGLQPVAKGLKLHLGSGKSRLQGWVNIDTYPAELAVDLRWGLPFDDESADYVFMSHVFEHFYYPNEAVGVLKEIHRVLSCEGRLRIIVPDIEKCIHAYVEHDATFFAERRKTWHWWPESLTRLEDFLAYAGAGPHPGLFLSAHKFGYDFETLEHALRKAGFSSVVRSEFMQSDDPVLRVDDISSVAGARYGKKYYSLFVEARP
jgi:SAM-dependent methyltransferase